MRNWLIFLSFFAACASKEQTQQKTSYESVANEKWVVYEGVVRSATGNDVKIELSLLQNSVGMESEYRTEEEYIQAKDSRLVNHRKGKYSILYGSRNDITVTLHETTARAMRWETGKGYSMDPHFPPEELVSKANWSTLSFRSGRNSNELILLDEHSNPVSQDGQYTLKSRSILFTVEGFVTISPAGSEFFEFHTRENWNVAKAGSYGEVVISYIEKARQKNEGIYLKGVAYYVEDIDSAGVDVKNLVIKRIVSMKSHEEYLASRTND